MSSALTIASTAFSMPRLRLIGLAPADDIFYSSSENRFCQHDRCGGSIAGDVGCFRSHFFDELSAHIFKFVFQSDFFRDSDTVFCGERRSEAFVDDDVASFGSEGDFYSFCEGSHPFESDLRASSLNCSNFDIVIS